MATELARTTSVRRIKNPDDPSVYVELKVIDNIRFYSGRDKGQEVEYSFSNDPSSNRETDAFTVVGETGDEVEVEIIRKLFSYNGRDNGQDAEWSFFGNNSFPPHHLETFDKKIYGDNGTNLDRWIEVRRVRAIKFYNGRDKGRDTEIRLNWDAYSDYTNLSPVHTQWDDTDINPPWRLDPFQQIINVSWGEKYAAIFYSGNRIAAIPMSKIVSDPTPIYDRPANGSWGSDILPTCQLKLQTGYSVIYSPLKVTETIVEGEPVATVSKESVYVMTTTQRKPADPEAPIIKALEQFEDGFEPLETTGHQSGARPMFNGDAGTYYTHCATFTINDTGISATQTGDPIADDRYLGAHAISKTGEYFYHVEAYGAGGLTATVDMQGRSIFLAGSASGTNGRIAYGTSSGVVEVNSGDAEANRPSTYSVTLNCPLLFYSKSDGLDQLDIIETSMSLSGFFNDGFDPDTDTLTFMSIGFSGEEGFRDVSAWPYNFDSEKLWWLDGTTSPDFTFNTPYGSGFTVSGTAKLWAGGGTAGGSLNSWLHVSNGSKTLQGFEIAGDRKLWLNDETWAPTGISAADIQTVLFDIPLARIQDLAPPPPDP